uniref:Pentatricopeptide repeat-containing protein n=1 Tax=Cannabis sativa TaxID=3483 RepID=A0A803PGB0_CANSA
MAKLQSGMEARVLADRYAAQLRFCCRQNPPSYSLARTLHAHIITSGLRPKHHIFNLLISIYCKSSKISYARQLFDKIPEADIVARTTLVSAYSANGNLKLAREIFNGTPLCKRDVVCYNAMITGYSRNNDSHGAIKLFCDMRRENVKPDNFTFTSVLSALALVVDDDTHCQQMHCAVVKSGTELVTSVLNALISVYVNCASSLSTSLSFLLMASARKLFNEMPERDEYTCTTMITGYVKSKDFVTARNLLGGMTNKDSGACWNAMLSSYVQHGYFQEALQVFREMYSMGISPDEFTYTSVLSACGNGGFFRVGKQIHARVLKMTVEPKSKFWLFVNNALVTFYYRCGHVNEARSIFDKMSVRDTISWTAILSGYVDARRLEEAKSFFSKIPDKNIRTWTVMISGLAQNGFGEEAVKLFRQMRSEGLEPCDFIFSGALTSSAVLGALEHGRQLHALLISLGHDSSVSAGNALITMYARCGVVEDAKRVPHHVTCGFSVLVFYDCGSGSTWTSHAGLVKEGCHYFNSMSCPHGISPDEDHYAIMIDLFCRSGKFLEADNLIKSMPFDPGAHIWESVLGGSWIHGNIDLGIKAAERLLELKPEHDVTYIILSNMYANVGRWEEVAKVRKLMRKRGVKKEPGCSWIEVDNKEHALSTHSEKIAVGFGLMKLPLGATIRVFKNLRICGDCHNAFKFISKALVPRSLATVSTMAIVGFDYFTLCSQVFHVDRFVCAVIQTAWKVASDGVEAGTNMVPASVPRPVAKVSVAIVGLTVSLFVIKSFLSTAFFVLATMGLVYFTFIALYKDEGPKGNDDNMTTTKGTPTSTEDSLEEARRIMEKYK